MKINDKEFIRELITSDLKHISNSDFTSDTLEKIKRSEGNKITYSNLGDKFFFIPMILYVSMSILLSFITGIISWAPIEEINSILHFIEIISGFLWHPITLSILFSFCLLYLMDLYLKKVIA